MLELFPDSARVERGALVARRRARASELAERFGTPLVVYCEETLRGPGALAARGGGTDGRRLLRDEGVRERRRPPPPRARRESAPTSPPPASSPSREPPGSPATTSSSTATTRTTSVPRARPQCEGAPVVLDAPDEAELAAAAGVERVLVRVTLGVDADTHEAVVTGHHGSKFGLPPDEAQALVADALDRGLDVLGLHVHVGSQLPDFTAQAETIRRLAEFAATCRDDARLGGASRRPGRRLRDPSSPRRRRAGRSRPRAIGCARRARGVRRRGSSRAGGLARAGSLARRPRRRHALPRRRRQAARASERGSPSTAGCRTTRGRSSTTPGTRR